MTTNSINATNGNITKKMNVVEKKIEGIFKNFQCKEDFEAKLERIEAAESDKRPFLIKDLVEMLKFEGVDCA